MQEDQPLLEAETANMLGRLDNYIQNPGQDRAIKSFFKPIIPASDYDALEAALFLRNEFHQHREVSKLKEDIRKKFGERGKNIANLCTAGYFENFLTDLYNASPGKFTELYDEIVKVGIFAVFVNQNMEDWEMATQIESKIAACKRYGLQFLDIHGIGKTNVKKVKEFIDKRKTAFKVYDKKIYESENKDIIIVRLLFS